MLKPLFPRIYNRNLYVVLDGPIMMSFLVKLFIFGTQPNGLLKESPVAFKCLLWKLIHGSVDLVDIFLLEESLYADWWILDNFFSP